MEKDTILCSYHASEFCFKSGEVRIWVGQPADEKSEECILLNTIEVYPDDDYIWVKVN